jgi:hypothetical protein
MPLASEDARHRRAINPVQGPALELEAAVQAICKQFQIFLGS